MTIQFQTLLQRISTIYSQTPTEFKNYAQEFLLTWNITTQRAIQVFNLYEFVDHGKQVNWFAAEDALKYAEDIMNQYQFRLPVERVAGWEPTNPTAYDFMYLWSAKKNYYFWRDRAKVSLKDPLSISPCFMNIINPIDVALGQGDLETLLEKLREMADKLGWPAEFIADCLAAPSKEPVFQNGSSWHRA